ncbi:DUF167 domain-containing protein [Salidesulfovibrio brasiliensis]
MTETQREITLPFMRPSRDGGWHLSIWAQPGAKRSELAGLYQDCLKIRLAAPAVDNKANKALVAFVAKTLGLKARHVRLEAGQTNRKKVLAVEAGCDPDFARLQSSS